MNEVFVKESPRSFSAGDLPVFSFYVAGATSIASPTAYLYKNGGTTNQSTLLTGSASTDGVSTITTPVVGPMVGGNTYTLVVKATINGVVTVRKVDLIIQKDSDEQA